MYLSPAEEQLIQTSIQEAEHLTSGEIRLYIEDFCDMEHPIERAAELFFTHGMTATRDRNAVLIYLAPKSRQFAIWGDAGIHERLGYQFWEEEKQLLRVYLQQDRTCEGLCAVISKIGEELHRYFPADHSDNPNELPNEILYGKK
jgi:uncharacterized membrane protein